MPRAVNATLEAPSWGIWRKLGNTREREYPWGGLTRMVNVFAALKRASVSIPLGFAATVGMV